MKLTTKSIRAFEYHGGWDVRWDDVVTGLGVRNYPSGKKAFVLSYRAQGRKRLMVLGRYGTVTLDEARKQARKFLVQVQEGKDPLEERQKEAQGQTFGDLVRAYIERHAKVHKKTWRDDEQRLNRHIPTTWKIRRVASITRQEISNLHHRIGLTKPYEANRLHEILRKMFFLARTWGFLDATADNPATGIERFKERSRKRWLTPDELPRVVKAIDRELNVYHRAGIWLLMLTGCRKGELLGATWDDVDWALGRLRLPETKTGEEQVVTLSAPALAILQAIPRDERNPRILPGARGRKLTSLDAAWRNIRKAAGMEDLQIHDLRRSVGSWLSHSGIELNLIKEALRHANISTTLAYARLGQDVVRDAMEDHGRRVLEAAGRRGPLVVVEGGAGKK